MQPWSIKESQRLSATQVTFVLNEREKRESEWVTWRVSENKDGSLFMPVDLTFTLHFIVFLEFENRLYMKTPNKLCVLMCPLWPQKI